MLRSVHVVADARLIELRQIRDGRGLLSIAEVEDQIPFRPVRFFTISEVPAGEMRGAHAHHTLEEFFVCVRGACTVTLDDGVSRQDVRLDRPNVGMYKPAMVWVELHSFTTDAILLALASKTWQDEDHIKDYDAFVRLKREAKR